MKSRYRSAFAGFSGFSFTAHVSKGPESAVASAKVTRMPSRKAVAKRAVREDTFVSLPRDEAA